MFKISNPFQKHEVKIEKRIHKGWKELESIEDKHINISKDFPATRIRQIFGKWQYILSSPKGKISIVYFPDYFADGISFWEIYCLEGALFEDTERKNTKEEAFGRAKGFLR